MILGGRLRPGDRLLQQQLAKQFGVSQSVLREALLEIQFTGLVEGSNGVGVSVARIDIKQVFDAYDVREMLEGMAARLCCAHASPVEMRELDEVAHRVHELGVAGRDQERAALDRQFHERTIAISGNEALVRLSGGYHVVRLVVLTSVPHDQVLADHLAIVEAIRANDPVEAERAARRHVVNARELVRRQIEANHFQFPWDAPPPPPPAATKGEGSSSDVP